jgi:hypothetical protein
MGSLAADLWTLAGLLAFLAFVLMSTLIINRNRKARVRRRRFTARLLNWK